MTSLRTLLQHARQVLLAMESGNIGDSNPLPTSSVPKIADQFNYEFLRLASGPTGTSGDPYDMDSNSSLGSPSIFELTITGSFNFSRVNFIIVDGSVGPNEFAGLGSALTNGCQFQIIDSDGSTVLKDFHNGVPIVRNADFVAMAGTDVPISELPGDDMLPIRFSVFKAGSEMRLTEGQIVRWTNRDNVSAITLFRGMVQGTYSD